MLFPPGFACFAQPGKVACLIQTLTGRVAVPRATVSTSLAAVPSCASALSRGIPMCPVVSPKKLIASCPTCCSHARHYRKGRRMRRLIARSSTLCFPRKSACAAVFSFDRSSDFACQAYVVVSAGGWSGISALRHGRQNHLVTKTLPFLREDQHERYLLSDGVSCE